MRGCFGVDIFCVQSGAKNTLLKACFVEALAKKTQTWYPNVRVVWKLKDVFPVQKRTGELLGSM